MMTPERKQELLGYLDNLTTVKIEELAIKHLAGELTREQVSHELGILSELAACVGTAYSALHMSADTLVDELRASLAGNKMLPAVKS